MDGENTQYTLQTYYNTIMQRVPVLLKYQFLTTFIVGTDTSGKGSIILDNYPAFCEGATLLTQSAAIPKRTLTTTDVNFFAKRFTMPATQKYEHEWNSKMILTHDMRIYSELRQMVLAFSSLRKNGGGIRNIPNINIQLDLLDQFSEKGYTATDVPRFILVGCFPTKVGKIDLKYTDADSNSISFDTTWTYQYSYMDRNHDMSGDPLLHSTPIE